MNKKIAIYLLGMVFFSGCGGEGDEISSGNNSDTALVVAVAGDFVGSGTISTIGVPSLETTLNVVDGVADIDPVIREVDGRIYIVNRSATSNITILDAETFALVDQFSTGAGFNPQDVAVKDNSIYVVGLGVGEIRIFDATDTAAAPRSVDLSGLDPVDGNPDCSSLLVAGDDLFVTCGLLVEFQANSPGLVVVLDTTNDTLAAEFSLGNPNPFGLLRATSSTSELGGDLLITTVPNFGDLSQGCLERINLDRTLGGCLVENSELGGYAASYGENSSGSVSLAITTGFGEAGPDGYVARYEAGTLTALITGTQSFDIASCPTGELAVAEAGQGLRIFGDDLTELTTTPISIGISPVQNGLICL